MATPRKLTLSIDENVLCALAAGVMTRDTGEFEASSIPALSPPEFLALVGWGEAESD